MTVFKWGEDPAGTWQLIFDDNMGRETQNKDPNKRDMEEVRTTCSFILHIFLSKICTIGNESSLSN